MLHLHLHLSWNLHHLSGYFKTWGTSLIYLLMYPCIVVFGQAKGFFQCIIYLLLILNSNMYWLTYIWCKLKMKHNFTFHSLFVFLFSWSVYKDDFLYILWIILYLCYLSPQLVFRRFLRSLNNVFLRTESSPVREK